MNVTIVVGSTLVGATIGGITGATRAYFAGDDIYNGFNAGAFTGALIGLSIGLGIGKGYAFQVARTAIGALAGVSSLLLGGGSLYNQSLKGGSFTENLDWILAAMPWLIFVDGSLMTPTGVLERYKKDIKDTAAYAPPELVGSVLMYELLQYNAFDTLFDDISLGDYRSIGIAQLRVDTVKNHGLFPGMSDYQIAQKLYNPHGAILALAREIQYIADARGVDLSNWDHLFYIEKLLLIQKFATAKDVNVQEYGIISPSAEKYATEGFDYINNNSVFK